MTIFLIAIVQSIVAYKKELEAIEAYKKELEEYNNSIAVATDDNQQPQKELVEEEEEHTTNSTIAGAKDMPRTVEYV